jgi:tight adherence protein B
VLALSYPGPALAVMAGWVVVHRLRTTSGPTPDAEAAALAGLVAELEGGSSPRAGLVRLARSSKDVDFGSPARLIAAGMPSHRVAGALGAVLPANGRLAAAAWALAGESGAPAAPVMAALARRAAERGRLDRERRAATAQARATAWVIAGLPLAVLVGLWATGRVGAGPALPVLLVGVALQVVGLAIAVVMVRRAS